MNRQIKIAYVIGQLAVGGTEMQLLALVRNLNRSKYRILVLCLSKQATLAEAFTEAGCEVQILRREEIGRLSVFRTLYRLLHSFQPDIVHSYAYASRAAMPISKLFSNARNVVSIRTQPGVQVSHWDYLLNSFADRILTNSQKAARSVRFGFFKPVPCQVIYNGVDLPKFDMDAGKKIEFKLPLAPNRLVICIVARLHSVKCLDVLLDAFAIVARNSVDAQLWLVGNGPEKEKLEYRAKELGINEKVIFWGEQKDIPAILKYVRVGVLSSRVEGLSNAIIEYMAARLPVVATDVGGNGEVVLHNQTGLLVPVHDVEALATALLYFLMNDDVAHQFGQAGRQQIERLFSLDRMVQETELVYEELLSK